MTETGEPRPHRAPLTAPLDVLVVSSWFPSIEDPVRGRFVADQVEALQGNGGVRVRVASFDRIALSGKGAARQRQADTARDATEDAIRRNHGLWHDRGWGLDELVPVARVPFAEAGPEVGGALHAAEGRRRALAVLADRPGWVPHLVHAHTSDPDGFAAIALADRFGVPLVVTEHASFLERLLDQPERLELARVVAKRAARLVAVGDEMAALLRRRLPEFADRVVVIPNAVATQAFTPRGAADRRPNELLAVGHVTEIKGIDILLRAFALVRARHRALRLRVIGPAPTLAEAQRWSRYAVELGVGDAVAFDGPMLRAGVVRAIEQATVLVHASRIETFGVVPVEALAAGLPVVATATAPVVATFGDRPHDLGELVAIEDPQALADGIERVLARRGSFDPRAMREAVESRFGGSVVAGRLVDLYRDVLGEQDRPSAATVAVREPSGLRDAASERLGPLLVVALDESHAGRVLGPLPDAILGRLTCVTGPDTQIPLPAIGTLLRSRGDQEYERLVAPRFTLGGRRGFAWRAARLALDPGLPLRRRRARRSREAMRLAAGIDVAGPVIASLGPGARVVCFSGLDHEVVHAVGLPSGVEIVPGGARWLADEAAVTSTGPETVAGQAAPGSELRLAVYAPADLNVIDGSAIWVESTLHVLSHVRGPAITVLLRAPVTREVLTGTLRTIPGVRLHRAGGHVADAAGRLSPAEAVAALESIDAEQPFHALMIRGYEACRIATERGSFDGRLLATYVLEPERDVRSEAYLDGLARIVRASRWTVVQSPEMAEQFISLVPSARGRLAILPPGLAAEDIAAGPAPLRERLVYAGKFTPYYALEELIDAYLGLRRRRPGLEFHMAGDKVMQAPGDPGYRRRMLRLLERTPGLTWHGALERAAVARLLREGGIALSVWNRPGGTDMNDLVVSTKLLDYCAAGVPVLATRTRVQAKLLGDDYPLFVDGPDDASAVLERALAGPDLQRTAVARGLEAAAGFTYGRIAASFAPYLAADPPT